MTRSQKLREADAQEIRRLGRQDRRAGGRPELLETEDHASGPPLTSRMEQKMKVEDEKDMGEVSFLSRVQSTSHAGPYTSVITMCRAEGFDVL